MSRISEEKCRSIREHFKATGSIHRTVKLSGASRGAVRRWLRKQSQPGHSAPATAPRTSKLDAYRAKITYLVNEKHLSAVRVKQEITPLGYPGGYSILKDYIRTIKIRTVKRPRPPIDHPPGEEAQMDWSPHPVIMAGKQIVTQIASLVLCYSRWIFLHFFSDQTIESVMLFHELAFKELGAVPKKITYDNMTTVGFHKGDQIWINPTFAAFARQWGFEIVILPPGAKERHGKVERPFRYVQGNFLAGREFVDGDDLNRRGDHWRATVANVRLHATLKERPVDRLLRERPFLLPLGPAKTDEVYKEVERRVNQDFCVAIVPCRYSTNPALIGHMVRVRLYRDRLEIWCGDTMDCVHCYSSEPGKRQVLPEHEQVYRSLTGQKRLLEEAFLRLGDAAGVFYEGLKTRRRAAAGYHLQRILKYADRYGADVVAGAMTHAARYGAYGADSVLRIILGKGLPKSTAGAAQKLPEHVRQWLQSAAVEKQTPGFYDKLLKTLEEEKE